jgi:hypothetical protein
VVEDGQEGCLEVQEARWGQQEEEKEKNIKNDAK